jgi:hypothetical protein
MNPDALLVMQPKVVNNQEPTDLLQQITNNNEELLASMTCSPKTDPPGMLV